MFSIPGPARLDGKGTLNERLTGVPGGGAGEEAFAPTGRLTGVCAGISLWDLDMPKPIEGVIFSMPCRATASSAAPPRTAGLVPV